MKTIEVIIAPDGSTRVQTRGYSGGSCREASGFLEKALGLRRSEQLTDEFYVADVSHQTHATQSTRQRP